jgi:hypothetical protein
VCRPNVPRVLLELFQKAIAVFRCGSKTVLAALKYDFRSTPINGHRQSRSACLKRANKRHRNGVREDETRPRSPRIAQRAGAGVGLRVVGKLAVEPGEQRHAVREAKLSAADASAEFFAGAAPLTTKLGPEASAERSVIFVECRAGA